MTDPTITTCPYCAVQCSFEIKREPKHVLALRSTPACPVAHGSVCKKGLAALEEPTHPERLLRPLVRKNGTLQPSTWDEAFGRVVQSIKRIQQQHGHDAYGVFGGGSLTNEKAYLLGKFARVALKTANIDYNGRFCMASAAAAMRQSYGLDRGLPFPLTRIAKASCIVLWGSNLAETLPPIAQFLTQAKKRGASIIVIDPRATPSTRLGQLHLPLRPGGDLPLALGLLNVIASEGWQHHDFLEERSEGWNDVATSVRHCTPTWAGANAGLEPVLIRQTAQLLAEQSRQPGGLLILSGRGPEQQANGVDTIKAIINLALALGGLYAPLTGQGNGQGGREHGQKNDQLPGYQNIEDAAARARTAAIWGVAPQDLPRTGLSAQELLESCGAGVKGLFVIASNPVVSAANSQNVARALHALDSLVVVDFFLSETAQLADVVLPGNMWLEEDGTVTNLEGRVLRRREVSAPPGQARHDWAIICEIARRLGTRTAFGTGFDFLQPKDIFDELCRATQNAPADYSGMTYAKLETGQVFWPCPSPDHPGTPEPFALRFARPNGKAKLHAVTHLAALAQTTTRHPVWLTTGRLSEHYQSGTQSRRNPKLNKVGRAALELHPNLAAKHGIQTGDRVRVRTPQGNAEFDVYINARIREDTVFVPFHFAGTNNANRLIGSILDPTSRMPAFKLAVASIERFALATPTQHAAQHAAQKEIT